MLQAIALRVTLLLLVPPLVGGIAGAYRAVMYQFINFTPEEEPGHIVLVQFSSIAIAALMIAFLFASPLWVRALKSWQGSRKLAQCIAGFLGAFFVFFVVFLYAAGRTAEAESAIVQKFGYCCCCERLPTTGETVRSVMNPFKIPFH